MRNKTQKIALLALMFLVSHRVFADASTNTFSTESGQTTYSTEEKCPNAAESSTGNQNKYKTYETEAKCLNTATPPQPIPLTAHQLTNGFLQQSGAGSNQQVSGSSTPPPQPPVGYAQPSTGYTAPPTTGFSPPSTGFTQPITGGGYFNGSFNSK